jgi:hypothetical protein
MVGKHECSENKHRNKYNNIELSCELGRSGWSNEQCPGHMAEEAVVSDCSESAVAPYFKLA